MIFLHQGIEDRTADGAGLIVKYPLELLIGEKLPLESVIFEKIIKETPAGIEGNDEDRIVMARAGNVKLPPALGCSTVMAYLFVGYSTYNSVAKQAWRRVLRVERVW